MLADSQGSMLYLFIGIAMFFILIPFLMLFSFEKKRWVRGAIVIIFVLIILSFYTGFINKTPLSKYINTQVSSFK